MSVADECPVCLCVAVPPVVLVPCGHACCDACLRAWLPVNRSCPVCRTHVVANVVPVGARRRVLELLATSEARDDDAQYVAPADGELLSEHYKAVLRNNMPEFIAIDPNGGAGEETGAGSQANAEQRRALDAQLSSFRNRTTPVRRRLPEWPWLAHGRC